MARLIADEDFPFDVVAALRRLGHDVVTAHQAGRANQRIPDSEVLDFAGRLGRIVLTLNRSHFRRLHLGREGHHHGIVTLRKKGSAEEIAGRIHAALDGRDCAGQLIRVVRGD